jgi:hypothetical protein
MTGNKFRLKRVPFLPVTGCGLIAQLTGAGLFACFYAKD